MTDRMSRIGLLLGASRIQQFRSHREAVRAVTLERDRRYRKHDDGTFSGPYKGARFGRGKPPTEAPPSASEGEAHG